MMWDEWPPLILDVLDRIRRRWGFTEPDMAPIIGDASRPRILAIIDMHVCLYSWVRDAVAERKMLDATPDGAEPLRAILRRDPAAAVVELERRMGP